MSLPAPVVGVDGCRGGWVAALAEPRTGSARLHLRRAARLASLVDWARAESAAVVAVDIPLGLAAAAEWRDCDLAARRLLPGAASRVFLTPPRAVVEAWAGAAGLPYGKRYAAARAAAPPGLGVSAQAAGLLDKVVEADDLARDGAALVEVHPELAFRAMTGAVLVPKRTKAGAEARLAALRRAWPTLAPDLVRDGDDADALAVAWSAGRLAAGHAGQVPPGASPLDGYGLPMRICW